MKVSDFRIRAAERLPEDLCKKLGEILKNHLKSISLEDGAILVEFAFSDNEIEVQANVLLETELKPEDEDDGA